MGTLSVNDGYGGCERWVRLSVNDGYTQNGVIPRLLLLSL